MQLLELKSRPGLVADVTLLEIGAISTRGQEQSKRNRKTRPLVTGKGMGTMTHH